MERKIICAVTGKNINDIGNGQNESYYKNVDIKLSIIHKISELIESGVTDFICNAVHGFPLWCCESIIALRNNRVNKGLRNIRLHIIMPHEEVANDYSETVHERFYQVHEAADSVLVLNRRFNDKCFENSERFIIDNSDFLFTDDENDFAAQYAWLHGKECIVCEKLVRT
jgi:uncharacterized phage-like protein YoqJ